jgi:AsmA protein
LAKIVLLTLSVLTLCLIFALCAVSLAIDPNVYKAQLAALIKAKTGRNVEFAGNIKLSFFPKLAINVEKILIKNWLNFPKTPFITAEKSTVEVRLLPLLRQQIKVNTVVLDGLAINLVTDKQGVNNWDAPADPSLLPQASDSDTPSTTKSALAGLTVGSIILKNILVHWDNQQSGEHLELKNLFVTANKFVFGEPIHIDTATEVASQHLKYPGIVKWATDLHVDEKLENFVFNGNHIELQGFKNIVPDSSLVSTITTPKAILSLTQQTLKLSGLQINSGDVKLSAEISADHIMDKPALQGTVAITPFNPRNTIKQWDIALPAMSDAKALTNLAIKFNVKASPDVAEFTDIDATLDDSHAIGSVTIRDFTQAAVSFDIAVDTINADRYFVPASKVKTSLASPGTGFAAGTFSLGLDGFRAMDAEGKLILGNLTFNRISIQDMRLKLSSKKGVVKIDQSANQFYQDSYSIDLNVDARQDKSS